MATTQPSSFCIMPLVIGKGESMLGTFSEALSNGHCRILEEIAYNVPTFDIDFKDVYEAAVSKAIARGYADVVGFLGEAYNNTEKIELLVAGAKSGRLEVVHYLCEYGHNVAELLKRALSCAKDNKCSDVYKTADALANLAMDTSTSRQIEATDAGPLTRGVWSEALTYADNDISDWQIQFADAGGNENRTSHPLVATGISKD